ncbi:MAG: 2Fe-2S iron-sulfur cluster-binding protein, partial [Bacteroidota bacterium]|nr:2Fe-2S iron-sulfur cluster-binding protein [Bacteroidota bacterium]
PEAMIQTVKSVLMDCQIPESKILFELFTVSEVAVDKNIENNLGAVKATILYDDASETITMASHITILEAALAEDLDVPYSCQGGVCSSCICRIKEGTAKMRQNSILTESEIAEGLVLSCQAVPTSQKIYVDFDDV